MYPQEPFVIVVGAGPSGLLLSLLLARAKIPVTLVEKASKLDSQPRATHYAAPAASVLRRAGVVDEVAARGFFPNKLTFRTLQNEVLGVVDHTIISENEERLICLPLNELGEILLARLQNEPFATILWDHEVMANIKDDNGIGFIVVKTPEGEKELRARYIVGCDGANSQIRRGLFGDWEFPGKTWDVQIVATNVRNCSDTCKVCFGIDNSKRLTTISKNLATRMLILLSTPSTGIWLRRSHKMGCGVSATVSLQV